MFNLDSDGDGSDALMATAVHEPETWAMLLAGLAPGAGGPWPGASTLGHRLHPVLRCDHRPPPLKRSGGRPVTGMLYCPSPA